LQIIHGSRDVYSDDARWVSPIVNQCEWHFVQYKPNALVFIELVEAGFYWSESLFEVLHRPSQYCVRHQFSASENFLQVLLLDCHGWWFHTVAGMTAKPAAFCETPGVPTYQRASMGVPLPGVGGTGVANSIPRSPTFRFRRRR